MILTKKNLPVVQKSEQLLTSTDALFSLPEKVLQFGTGVLLRGLPDYYIDKANKQNIFNGRIVVVKSTSNGDTNVFSSQNNLYTQCVRGISNGEKVDAVIVNSSISRVLTANEEWAAVIKCAENPQLQIIISNTTEVGITLLENDNVYAAPPLSFPGKLLAFLLARYTAFNGSTESGMVIIPTELITENGTKLKQIVIELAKQNKLENAFIQWVETANDFCNSLVDRIVPGKLPQTDKEATEARLGVKDDLMIMSEIYSLWAIETANKRTKDILSFSKADDGVVLANDIDKFRELKLRLLNGSHTFTCALAVLSGFTTVKQAMGDSDFQLFIKKLMIEEIVPSIVSEKVTAQEGYAFAEKVLDRYKNPFIEHLWLSISLQYSSKMKMRNIPVLLQHYEKTGNTPQLMAVGFAAYLLFMKSTINDKNEYVGECNNKQYPITDDKALKLHQHWAISNPITFTEKVLSDETLWGVNLAKLTGFAESVQKYISLLTNEGALATIKKININEPSLK